MIIIQLAGGLGNQLQQYALYKKMAGMGKDVRLDTSWFDAEMEDNGDITSRKLELNYFNGISYEACLPEERKKLIGNSRLGGKIRRKLLPGTVKWFHESKMYHPELFDFDDMYVSGYFACEKYYADILKKLREEICFPKSDNSLNHELMKEMQSVCSVSVHIRRGDYLNDVNKEMFGGICTDAYYRASMELIKRKFPEARFYLFSDDTEYAKAHYQGSRYMVVDWNKGKDSFYDMQLMSCCRHNICANSTFSFWGARLNGSEDKIMIRPAVHKNSQEFVKEEMFALWENWVFADKAGHVFENCP